VLVKILEEERHTGEGASQLVGDSSIGVVVQEGADGVDPRFMVSARRLAAASSSAALASPAVTRKAIPNASYSRESWSTTLTHLVTTSAGRSHPTWA
jgi:hypothetical protein